VDRFWLTLNRVAYIFNSFADFASRFTEAFLGFAANAIGVAFCFEIRIVERFADTLFNFAFSLIPFAFYFISVW
jgi:hypothetical protein